MTMTECKWTEPNLRNFWIRSRSVSAKEEPVSFAERTAIWFENVQRNPLDKKANRKRALSQLKRRKAPLCTKLQYQTFMPQFEP
jgi:hypothetical protein